MSFTEGSFPFRSPDAEFVQTLHRKLFSYEAPSAVLKVDKEYSGRPIFSGWEEAAQEIARNQAARLRLAEWLQPRHPGLNLVPDVLSVIHQKPGTDKVTYSEVQSKQNPGIPLAQLGDKWFELSPQALTILRDICQFNQVLLTQERTSYDLDGSRSPHSRSFSNRLVTNLFPIFYSWNIVLDPQGLPVMIDVENIDRNSVFLRSGLKGWGKRQLKQTGMRLSLLGITLLTKMNKKSLPDYGIAESR